MTCQVWPTRSLQSRGTFGREMPSSVEHTQSRPKPQSGSQLWEIVAKILRSIPMENIKGLSLEEAMVCPSLPDCCRQMDLNYKYYFPKLFLRTFCCGRSAARTSGMGPGPRLRGTLGGGVNSSALRCHSGALQKDNQLQECLLSTNCWKKSTGSIPAPLEDTS